MKRRMTSSNHRKRNCKPQTSQSKPKWFLHRVQEEAIVRYNYTEQGPKRGCDGHSGHRWKLPALVIRFPSNPKRNRCSWCRISMIGQINIQLRVGDGNPVKLGFASIWPYIPNSFVSPNYERGSVLYRVSLDSEIVACSNILQCPLWSDLLELPLLIVPAMKIISNDTFVVPARQVHSIVGFLVNERICLSWDDAHDCWDEASGVYKEAFYTVGQLELSTRWRRDDVEVRTVYFLGIIWWRPR